MTGRPLRIANCSGFYGDRFEAAREMVEGGPVDVLTGDYLAELTMAILWRHRSKDPSAGYATTFLRQMEQVLGTCCERGIKVVANAGGLNPAGLAARIDELAERLGLEVAVGCVAGDDLIGRLDDLLESGVDLSHADHGRAFSEIADRVLTANAYLGGWGIASALEAGADVVVTGRVADANLVSGPAAWHFGWQPNDWDAIAGAVVAGHVVECGAQCTGGNYSFFGEVPGLEHPGFPIAEVSEDGSTVITKHPGTGGAVTTETVVAQLLYEIDAPAYLNPDVVARFDTIELRPDGEDRVAISGVSGEPAPSWAKVGINHLGGFRNLVTLLIPGPDVEAKAALAETALRQSLTEGVEVDFDLLRSDWAEASRSAEAFARLRVTVKSAEAEAAGRAFSGRAVELALSSYPGFTMTAPPGPASPYAVYWPALVPARLVSQEVEVAGRPVAVPVPPQAGEPPGGTRRAPEPPEAVFEEGECLLGALGEVVGSRSGDKGGNANLGVWARSHAGFDWLRGFLTVDRLRTLLPETGDLRIERYELPNLRALNFVIHGLLGEGVSSSTRLDPQAKALGEFLRTRLVEIPVSLLAGTG